MGLSRVRFGQGVLSCAAAALVIAFFTLRPAHDGGLGFRPGGYLLTDLILNIVLFVPWGLALAYVGASVLRAGFLGFCFSAAIELAQLLVIPGRYASLHDIVTNTAGTVLGALIATRWSARETVWRVVGLPIGIVIVISWIGGTLLLAPSIPAPRDWYSQWAHQLGDQPAFSGQVLSMTLQDRPLPDGRIGSAPSLFDTLAAADTIRFEVSVVVASPLRSHAQLASVVASGNESVGVWEEGTAISARHRLALTEAGLRTPSIRLNHALAADQGDTVRIVYELDRRAMHLSATGRDRSLSTEMRLTPDLFWSAFLPFDWQGGSGGRWWPLVPALLSCLVLGMGLGARPFHLGAAILLMLFPAPLSGHGAFPDGPLWLVAIAGPLAGALLSRFLGLTARETETA